jgi:hypothetical protein
MTVSSEVDSSLLQQAATATMALPAVFSNSSIAVHQLVQLALRQCLTTTC